MALQEIVKDARAAQAISDAQPPAVRVRSIPPAMAQEEIVHRERLLAEQEARQVLEQKRGYWSELIQSRGLRYRSCTFDNFSITHPKQQPVVTALRTYCEDIRQHVDDGRGVLLFGPRGTGKDHLAVAVCRAAVAANLRVRWVNAVDLYGDVRDLMDDGGSERNLVERMARPDLLYLSDPIPPSSGSKKDVGITDFQSCMLFRILDARYSRLKPLIVTVNVSGRDELDQWIGAQNSDRIRDGALALYCDWPSHRKIAE